MFCVGLTGNIATGKSTVANIFKSHGAHLINADQIAKALTLKGAPAYAPMLEHFGPAILLSDGQFDRKKLRQLIFSKLDEKRWLENFLHPLIRKEIEEQIENSSAPYVVLEIPLHFNRENYPYINRVLLVTAPESVQIQRIMERDQCNEEEAKAMLINQPSLEKRLSIADDVIDNTGNQEELMEKINQLHNLYQDHLSN